jgi:hypothetical protein
MLEDPRSESPLSDDELTALALAADPSLPLEPDAVPVFLGAGPFGGALPMWYMPPVSTGRIARWRTPFVVAVVGAFLLIEVLGLCNTYGTLGL